MPTFLRAALAAVLLLCSTAHGQALGPKPAPPPARWLPLIGEYARGRDTLLVYEADGELRARIAQSPAYLLAETADTTFALVPGKEGLTFRRDARGRVREADLAGSAFTRVAHGPEEGNQLLVRPVRPVDSLIAAALRAAPPAEQGRFRDPHLVDLAALDSTITFDIRYATTNNFLGTPFYRSSRAFLQRPAADALLRAHRRVRGLGYGVLIHDAYRPWYVTKVFWDATPDSLHWLVADPATGSRHNRGCAVDLTLYELATGRPVEMVGTYDEASPRSHPDYPGGTSLQRWHRALLRWAMESEGFTVYEAEWWHFDYGDWRAYPILNRTFEQLGPGVRPQDGQGAEPLPRGDLFHPLLADPKQPQFFASFLWVTGPRLETQVSAIGLGENVGLVRAQDGRWQLSVAAAVFSQFNMRTTSNDLLNSDFIIGVPFSWRRGATSGRVRLYHQSSHLGDEFILNTQPERVNLSFESIEALVSQEAGNWRVYGGAEYIVRHEPADLEPALLHAGLEYRHSGPLLRLGRLGSGRFVAALDAKSIQERKWQVGWGFRAGVEFGPVRQGLILGRSWSVTVDGYDGPAPYGQFYEDTVSSLGVGLHFTL